ncbi:MAG: DUF779 domain-containing protein [Pseudomonadota bacterium]
MNSYVADFDLNNPIAGADTGEHVEATASALKLLKEIQKKHGEVSIHHEGGYANGSDAMCLPVGELRISDRDILLGVVAGSPIFVYGRNVQDWDDRRFVLDAIPGTGGAFSLDAGTGYRFFVRSKPFVDAPANTQT